MFFGFVGVPAFDGETPAVNVDSGVWATAPAATARVADAATAPMISLRKVRFSSKK